MLVFCEECGCRNILNDIDTSQQTVRFRCVSCDYENVWQPPQADNALQQEAVAGDNQPHEGTESQTPTE